MKLCGCNLFYRTIVEGIIFILKIINLKWLFSVNRHFDKDETASLTVATIFVKMDTINYIGRPQCGSVVSSTPSEIDPRQ